MKLDVPNYYLYYVPNIIHVEFKNENCIFRICNGSFRKESVAFKDGRKDRRIYKMLRE